MNAPLRQAELTPHRFTVREFLEIAGSGAFGDRKVELIEGEIIDMPSDGPLHRRWSVALTDWLADHLDRTRYVHLFNTTLELSDHSAPSPDVQVYDRSLREEDVRGPNILLAIEQADTSLKKDLRVKADLYARFGVRDYWVIDLNANRIHVHRSPAEEGYRDVAVHSVDRRVEALLIPGLSLRIADLSRIG